MKKFIALSIMMLLTSFISAQSILGLYAFSVLNEKPFDKKHKAMETCLIIINEADSAIYFSKEDIPTIKYKIIHIIEEEGLKSYLLYILSETPYMIHVLWEENRFTIGYMDRYDVYKILKTNPPVQNLNYSE